MKIKVLIGAGAALLGAMQAQALTVFSDDFDTENGGVGVTNYNGFANWTVSGGTVDLIGNGYFDFLPGNGLYVDMDGSTVNAGKLTSIAIPLLAGNYRLSYYLAGNQRNGADEAVNVGVEVGLASTSHSLNETDPFQLYTLDFAVGSAQSVNITFEGLGGDNIGMLLDNVSLDTREAERVPDGGATAALLGLGLAGFALLRRRLN